jgi:hypothetical protein
LIHSIQYGTVLNYSPRGTSENSQKSRDVRDLVKAGRPVILNRVIERLAEPISFVLNPLLSSEVIFIPIPRSTLIRPEDLWPALYIAQRLHEAGYGNSIETCINRVSSIRKSSAGYSADTRPTIKQQMESITVTPLLVSPPQITLIDDVLTMGRTSMACALRLNEIFPEAIIRVFAVIRTQGLIPNIESIFDPSLGEIGFNEHTVESHRNP